MKFMREHQKLKKQLEIALTELEELGMKVDVVYLSDKER